MPSFLEKAAVGAALACVSIWAVAPAGAATDERLSKPELEKLNQCMGMTPEALNGDAQCTVVLRKASLTKSDVEKMRRCEAKLHVDVSKDPDCAAMMKKHPDLVRGHGSLMPDDQTTSSTAK